MGDLTPDLIKRCQEMIMLMGSTVQGDEGTGFVVYLPAKVAGELRQLRADLVAYLASDEWAP